MSRNVNHRVSITDYLAEVQGVVYCTRLHLQSPHLRLDQEVQVVGRAPSAAQLIQHLLGYLGIAASYYHMAPQGAMLAK